MYFISNQDAPHAKLTRVIGLDIGSKTLKATMLEKKNTVFHVKKSGFLLLSSESFRQNQLVDEIKRLLNTADINITQCVTALSDILVSSRWLRFERTVVPDLEKVISGMLVEQIPHQLHPLYFDYQVFESSDVSQQAYLDVLLIVCRKKHLERRVEVLTQANLQPLAIEVNSHALERAYMTFYPDEWIQGALIIEITVSQLTFLFTGKNQKSHSYSEKREDKANSATLLQQLMRALNLLWLRYTQLSIKKIFLLSVNCELIEFLQLKLSDRYALTVEIIATSCPRVVYSENQKNNPAKKRFTDFFLSFGLALRGLV